MFALKGVKEEKVYAHTTIAAPCPLKGSGSAAKRELDGLSLLRVISGFDLLLDYIGFGISYVVGP